MKYTLSLIAAFALLLGVATVPGDPGKAADQQFEATNVVVSQATLNFADANRIALEELASIEGGAPAWVETTCSIAGGLGAGWGFAGKYAAWQAAKKVTKKVVKRAVITIVCPQCGTALAIVGFACLFF